MHIIKTGQNNLAELKVQIQCHVLLYVSRFVKLCSTTELIYTQYLCVICFQVPFKKCEIQFHKCYVTVNDLWL